MKSDGLRRRMCGGPVGAGPAWAVLTWAVLIGGGMAAEPAEKSTRQASAEKSAEKPTRQASAEKPAVQDRPTAREPRTIEGWTVRVDTRLLADPHAELGRKALRFLEAKLADITAIVPADRVRKLREVTIVLDLDHGDLKPMQYHPDAGWLEAHGYSKELAKCVHLPRAVDVASRRNIREQPWVILHELAHAYHDQALGFEEPRIKAAYEKYKASGRGDATLLHDGRRTKHYALTNQKEFFAEMTEAYFGSNDFYPFNRAELQESEPEIKALLRDVWEKPLPE